jgi:hypothetical protein
MMDKGNPEFEPIEKDEKNTKIYFCVGCGGVATQTALYKIEGAVILERYCDICSSKLNESTSGT